MTFTHALSRRLALLRDSVTIAALAIVASCDLFSPIDTSGLDVAQVVVVPGSTTLEPEQNYQFAAYGRTTTGDSLAVAVVWSTTSGTISSGGRYIADSLEGDYEVRATLAGTAANAAASSGSSLVRVRKLAQLLVTPATATLPTGGTQAFAAYGRLKSGDSVAVTVTWSATGGSISAAGLYTAGSTLGQYAVTATGKGFSTGATVTLTTIAVASLSVSPASATLALGATQQLSAVTKDSAGNTLTGRVVTWSSSSPTIATVSGSGLVTAVAAGSATITATSEGKSGTSAITVQASLPVSHAGHYVAPTGSPTGDGSATRPWDLATALAQPTQVQPGDTIWLRGGTYSGGFTSRLTGTAAAPIIVRQYPNERATINTNGVAFVINGSYTWYWGFEVANTNTVNHSVMGVDLNAPGGKLINLVVHDHSSNGIGVWEPAPNSEVYGCIIYNNGFYGSIGPGSAHGIYNQNQTGTRLLKDNILFNQYKYDIHMYGESGFEENTTVDGNVWWGSGLGMIVRSQQQPTGIVIRRNMVYMSPGQAAFAIGAPLGFPNVYDDLTFTDNYVFGESNVFSNWTTLLLTGNTFISAIEMRLQVRGSTLPTSPAYVWNNNAYIGTVDGFGNLRPNFGTWLDAGPTFVGYTSALWPGTTGYDLNSTFTATGNGKPATNRVFVRPNTYEAGRANIIVYNWQLLGSVSVDVSGVLPIGARYEVRNVQDWWGIPVLSGTYAGGSLSIPMGAITPPVPIAQDQANPRPVTGPEFNTFVVLRTGP